MLLSLMISTFSWSFDVDEFIAFDAFHFILSGRGVDCFRLKGGTNRGTDGTVRVNF